MVDILYLSNTTSNTHKYLILIQDEKYNWKIASDIPVAIESIKHKKLALLYLKRGFCYKSLNYKLNLTE